MNCLPIRKPVHHLINKRWQWQTGAEHSRLMSVPPLMRAGIHKNIPVPDTILRLRLRGDFISSHSTEDKLFPVNPRATTDPPKMSLPLEAKSMPALEQNVGWNKTSNQQPEMLVQNLNRIASRSNVTREQILHCTANCIPINLMFRENFPTNTQVWNSLNHRNDCRERWVIWVTYGCYNSNPY